MFRYVYQDKLGNVVNTNLTHVTWEDKVTEVKVSPLPLFPTTEGSLPKKNILSFGIAQITLHPLHIIWTRLCNFFWNTICTHQAAL